MHSKTLLAFALSAATLAYGAPTEQTYEPKGYDHEGGEDHDHSQGLPPAGAGGASPQQPGSLSSPQGFGGMPPGQMPGQIPGQTAASPVGGAGGLPQGFPSPQNAQSGGAGTPPPGSLSSPQGLGGAGGQMPPGQFGGAAPPGSLSSPQGLGGAGGQMPPGQFGGGAPPGSLSSPQGFGGAGGQMPPGQFGGAAPPGSLSSPQGFGGMGAQPPSGQFGGAGAPPGSLSSPQGLGGAGGQPPFNPSPFGGASPPGAAGGGLPQTPGDPSQVGGASSPFGAGVAPPGLGGPSAGGIGGAPPGIGGIGGGGPRPGSNNGLAQPLALPLQIANQLLMFLTGGWLSIDPSSAGSCSGQFSQSGFSAGPAGISSGGTSGQFSGLGGAPPGAGPAGAPSPQKRDFQGEQGEQDKQGWGPDFDGPDFDDYGGFNNFVPPLNRPNRFAFGGPGPAILPGGPFQPNSFPPNAFHPAVVGGGWPVGFQGRGQQFGNQLGNAIGQLVDSFTKRGEQGEQGEQGKQGEQDTQDNQFFPGGFPFDNGCTQQCQNLCGQFSSFQPQLCAFQCPNTCQQQAPWGGNSPQQDGGLAFCTIWSQLYGRNGDFGGLGGRWNNFRSLTKRQGPAGLTVAVDDCPLWQFQGQPEFGGFKREVEGVEEAE